MKEQMLSPGDVLGFPIDRIGRFGACQIVAADTSKQQVTVALLDWGLRRRRQQPARKRIASPPAITPMLIVTE